MGNAMTSTWTKQEVDKYDAHKLRFYLRRDTPFRSAEEFFTALLVQHGAPPYYPEIRHARTPNLVTSTPEFNSWRNAVAITMNEHLHCSIDPSMVMRKYFLWLQENWNKPLFAP